MQVYVDIQCKMANFSLAVRFNSLMPVSALFGSSGAGKTTLLHALAGLVTPARGEIIIDNQVVFDSKRGINMPPEERPVGIVFQDGRLFPHLNVLQNLRFPLHAIPRKQPSLSLDEVVDRLELQSLLKKRIQNLSGGQRQRVALGRTLLSGSRLLLLDEPLSALDVSGKQKILTLFSQIPQRFDTTLLIVSHSLCDLLQLTDYFLLLDGGRLTDQGHIGDELAQQHIPSLTRSMTVTMGHTWPENSSRFIKTGIRFTQTCV